MSVLNSDKDKFTLAPFDYPWAWEMFLNSMSNHWTPLQIGMGADKDCFNTLNENDQDTFIKVFATLTSSDRAIGNNLAEYIHKIVLPGELRIFIERQITEEAIHSWTYQHVLETLGLDPKEIYSLYRTVPEIRAKFEFAESMTTKMVFNSPLLGLIFYYAIFEGIWFYHGFTPIFAMGRRNLMTSSCQQLQYIMRDEDNHAKFGIKLINTIISEDPTCVPTTQQVHSLFRAAVEIEETYATRVIKDSVGYNAKIHVNHTKYMANRRLAELGYAQLYEFIEPVTWLDEMVFINKETNFFEKHVTEYQSSSSLTWD